MTYNLQNCIHFPPSIPPCFSFFSCE